MAKTALQVLKSERTSLAQKRAALDVEIKKLEAAIAALGGTAAESAPGPKKFTMSAAARARIAAYQKARWAKIHAAKKAAAKK